MSTLRERAQQILTEEINPTLADHGGSAELVDITAQNIALIKFSGGCRGCAFSRYTLVQGIETRLLAACPELIGVEDVTVHEVGPHSFA